MKTWIYSDTLDDYRLDQQQDNAPDGAVTTFTYYDVEGFPDRVKTETTTGEDGLGNTLANSSMAVFDSDGNDRVVRQISTGPKAAAQQACGDPPQPGCVTSYTEYDLFGRVTKQVENYQGTDPEPRVSEFVYNAFDDRILSAEQITSGATPTYLVRASVYNNLGQLEHAYACEYTGDLALFGDLQNPARQIFRQTSFQYHSLSGATTVESTVLSDVVPFSFSEVPTTTADVVNNYDSTGTWLTSVTRPADSEQVPAVVTTVFKYDTQGRRRLTISHEGVVSETIYDGRGLASQSITKDDETSPTITLALTRHYNPDGQAERIDHPDGSFTANGFDPHGRADTEKRCDTADCSGSLTIITTNEYDDSGNVTRQYTPGVLDTVTEYDDFDRAFRVRRRATIDTDDDDESDGVADEVTLTQYNAVGFVESTAGKRDSLPGQLTDGVDQITSFVYDNLGAVTRTTRQNLDAGGIRKDEVTESQYDEAGRKTAELVCIDDGADPCATVQRTDVKYDALGRLKSIIDPVGHYVEQHFDARGKLIHRIIFEDNSGDRDGAGGVPKRQERWVYDEGGRLKAIILMADASVDPVARESWRSAAGFAGCAAASPRQPD